eukprot:TRINITY_DN26519_c0_g1_i1.p1 TRINITY_DN26519_c0_g1~~TRINITY_DN26519_c0_g1_i1.p1  ORF type:complete len:307 (+),score=74.75 TRINITY_DN26519_c0_g1_i1:126-1046(+)
MEAEDAYSRNGSILCLDVPEGTEFGIDYQVWEVGPKFKGVKLMPPGIHFCYYSGRGKLSPSGAPRIGFFVDVHPGEVFVRRWSPATEDFLELSEMDKAEVERFIEGVRKFEFDQFLGPYPTQTLQQWTKLSNFITPLVLEVLEPVGKKISSVYDKIDPKEAPFLPPDLNAESNAKHRPFFSDVGRGAPKGLTPQEVTRFHLDKSSLIDRVSERYKGDARGLLGELQFAFVCFVMGQSFDAFEQWKQLVRCFTGCDDKLETQPDLFVDFMGVLQAQLENAPEDFFDDLVTENNFLGSLLQDFFSTLG